MPSVHAKLSASGSHRWMNCPGSIELTKDIPNKTSAFATEGTVAHEVAEMCLKEDKSPKFFLGAGIEADGTSVEVTEEMVGHVDEYVKLIRSYIEEEKPDHIGVEEQFSLDHLHPDMFGTNDFCCITALGTLHIFDLKYGQGVVVDVEENPQLMYYGLGALHEHGSLFPETVTFHIFQPRAYAEQGAHREWSISADDLRAWGDNVLVPAAKRTTTKEGKADLNAGEWCRFCSAKPVCPEICRIAKAEAKNAFTDLSVEGSQVLEYPNPNTLRLEKISDVLALAPLFTGWLDDVRAYAKEQLEQGIEIPGYKLVNGKSSRSWKDKSTIAEALSALNDNFSVSDFEQRSPLSPAQAEKKLIAKGVKRDSAKQVVSQHVVTSRGRSVAPTSDKREAITVENASEVFDNV